MNTRKNTNKLKLIIFIIPLLITSCSMTKNIKNPTAISEKQFLEINNTRQFVLIRGENINNPVLLFLHGGPGATETSMLRKYNSDLEKHFIVVYWDQRNTGKSYDKKFPKEEIKVQKYIQDVDILVRYLKERFKKEKILLVGHSWGSRLGMYAVQQHPENFIAYVGVAQDVSAYECELISYQFALKKAKELNKTKALKKLEEMGEPQNGEYAKMYKTGIKGYWSQKRMLMGLGGDSYKKGIYLEWMLSVWFSREYSFSDVLRYFKTFKFSFDNIVKDPDFNNFDFIKQIPEVKIPVYFISGSYDYILPWTLSEKYCDTLIAPYKEFIKFDKSGHNPLFEEPEKFNKEIIRIYNQIKEKEGITQGGDSNFLFYF
ncbi:MAG: alpha/beta hydrolase [Bacteroidetes bacterium]|nr:alpha/beta hydrolase [Bacteroidota bacterium]